MNKFDTAKTTLTALTKNKKPDCVDALTTLFNIGINEKGYSNREAYHFAELTHFHADHDGANHQPELIFEATDENARQHIVDDLMALNSDGQAEDRVDLTLKWYDLFRSHKFPVASSFLTAISASQDEWESTHDLDEAEGIKKIEAIELSDPATKELLFKEFYAARNEGETVYSALRIARDAAAEVGQRQVLLSMLSYLLGNKGGPDLPDFIN